MVTSSSVEPTKLNKQIHWLQLPQSRNRALNPTSPEEYQHWFLTFLTSKTLDDWAVVTEIVLITLLIKVWSKDKR